MTKQEAIKYAKTCIDNIRKYEGNEQFIAAMDAVIAIAEENITLSKSIEEKIESIVEQHRECRWLDGSELEASLKEIAVWQKKIDIDLAHKWWDRIQQAKNNRIYAEVIDAYKKYLEEKI